MSDQPNGPAPAPAPIAGITVLMLNTGQAQVQVTGPSPLPAQLASALLWIAGSTLAQAAGALPAADQAAAPRVILAPPGAKIPRA